MFELELGTQNCSEQNSATPASTQLRWSLTSSLFLKSSRSEGTSIHITKLVECPVVDSVPARSNVL